MDLIGKLNLLSFPDATEIEYCGKEGLFLPYESIPSIYRGKKGIYCSMTIKERKFERFGDTHFAILSPRGSIDSNFTKVFPIVGNFKISTYSPIQTGIDEYNPLVTIGDRMMRQSVADNIIASEAEDDDIPL